MSAIQLAQLVLWMMEQITLMPYLCVLLNAVIMRLAVAFCGLKGWLILHHASLQMLQSSHLRHLSSFLCGNEPAAAMACWQSDQNDATEVIAAVAHVLRMIHAKHVY